jgi:hypothetical protein
VTGKVINNGTLNFNNVRKIKLLGLIGSEIDLGTLFSSEEIYIDADKVVLTQLVHMSDVTSTSKVNGIFFLKARTVDSLSTGNIQMPRVAIFA